MVTDLHSGAFIQTVRLNGKVSAGFNGSYFKEEPFVQLYGRRAVIRMGCRRLWCDLISG